MSTTETTTPVVTDPTELKKGSIGTSIPRKEDGRLVQGQGVFFDDIRRHGTGYVHFVRSPYAHAKIVSVDVSAALALEGVYGTLTGDEVAIHTDPFFEMSTPPGRAHQGLRARRRDDTLHGRARRRGRGRHPRARARRGRAGRGRVRAARRARRRARGGQERDRDARRGRLERRLERRLRLGRLGGGEGRGRPHRHDRRAPLPPLQLDAARVLGRARRVRARHRPVDALLQPPDAGHRRDLDGAGAAGAARQAPLRHPRHRRRLREQDLPASVLRRPLPAGAEARPADPVDGVAHRPAHRERARQRALVPRRRGRGQGRRDDARLQRQGARRLRRLPPLRAARLHHLGPGDARLLRLAEHPRRLHAGDDEQVAGLAEPRLLADAAPLADRADHRHRRLRARARSRRGAQAELRQGRADAVRDAERVRLRLRGLRALPRHGARARRLRGDRGAAGRGGEPRQAARVSGSARRSTRGRTTSASRRS